ncbi:MAG: hypothetical protein JWR80_9522 [Bradyrhizobium sp.]|nr:hypothetical protein [Bradyrhizobium sp.]
MTDTRIKYLAMVDRHADTDRVWREHKNAARAERRRQLYRDDPIWRLTKLADNHERRLRAKRQAEAAG